MKTKIIMSGLIILPLLVAGCSEKDSKTADNNMPENKTETMAKVNPFRNQSAVQGAKYYSGKLIETFDSGGYTYVHLDTADGKLWAAGPTTSTKVGDKIGFASKMLMKNFTSKTKNREFKEIYFAGNFIVNGSMSTSSPKSVMPTMPMAGAHSQDPHKNKIKTEENLFGQNVKKLKNGQSIADILADIKGFRGKTIKVRGQVSRFTANILGTNWVHIRDASTNEDLTVTTQTQAKPGDVVLIEGQLLQNKDYGKGFVYDLVVHDAKMNIE